MFKAGGANPYEDIVVKTTDENLTSENWELILNLCDKVQDEGEEGARNVIAAVLKRLTHRSSNVQLYALSLVEALSKNCGKDLHREMASRVFTQGLERLVSDRTTHEKVRRRTLGLMVLWIQDFQSDPSLSLMEESYKGLESKNFKYVPENEPPPPDADEEARRREEEELQRVLEMSVLDKGGRGQWSSQYNASGTGETSGAGFSNAGPSSSAAGQSARPGYIPAPASTAPRSPTPPQINTHTPAPTINTYTPEPTTRSPPPATQAPGSPTIGSPIVTRVRALYAFEPTEAGELGFDKGDVIKVVDRGYKDWWRGQIRGRTGIFPVNYVEPLPEPTAGELAKEAEQEAQVFSQAANIDKLLTMLRNVDSTKDNLADNEEIQELYRQSMAVRPKIVKLIDKYSQKRADLVSMNESFVKARTIFDQMMEESLARHSAAWDGGRPSFQTSRPISAMPDSYRGPTPAQPYGWTPQGYEQQQSYGGYTPQANGYEQQPQPQFSGAQQPQQQGYQPDVAAYGQGQQPQSYQPQGYPGQQPQPPYGTPTPYAQGPPQSQPGQPQQQVSPQPIPTQPAHPPAQSQFHPQAATQPQIPAQTQPQPQASQQSPPPQGPPYVYDPNTTYPDPNVQAWAHYYANGGTDKTGAVYFVSVPGITDGQDQSARMSPPVEQQQQPQQEPQPAITTQLPTEHQNSAPYLPYPGEASAASQGSPQAAASGTGVGSPSPTHQSYMHRQSSTGSLPYPGVSRQSTYGAAAPMSPIAASAAQPYGDYSAGPLQSPSQMEMPNSHAQYQGTVHQLQGQFAGMGVGEGSSHLARSGSVSTTSDLR